jgi:SAM-dependent methyltransferase
MGRLQNFVTPLHRKTARNYVGRMVDDKVGCMKLARQYELDYWDGSRRTGYGGYNYDGRWVAVARQMIDEYKLQPGAKILDIGCGKGFLLYELTQLLPGCEATGIDVSQHALKTAKEEIRPRLMRHRAQDPLPFPDQHFDLAISLTTLHNLPVQELNSALQEMQRVAKNKYLLVESFRDEEELFNLQCWAFTCESFLRPESWQWMFEKAGYTGDYEYIYFEGAGDTVANRALSA